jgi:hypothetical protein
MSCFVDIVLWIFFFLTRLYYESDCYICMKNAVPKGVECRNYTKIEQCQLCLATIPLVCLLVFSCKSNSNLAAWGYGYICTLNVGGRSEIMVHLNTALGCTQLSGFRAQFGTWDNLFLIMYQLKSWPSFVVWFRITCCLRRKSNLKTSLGVGRVVFICLFPPINEMMCSSEKRITYCRPLSVLFAFYFYYNTLPCFSGPILVLISKYSPEYYMEIHLLSYVFQLS